MQIADIDIFDPCRTKLRIRNNPGLTARKRHSINPEFLQRRCHNAGCHDFAAAHHHIQFAHVD